MRAALRYARAKRVLVLDLQQIGDLVEDGGEIGLADGHVVLAGTPIASIDEPQRGARTLADTRCMESTKRVDDASLNMTIHPMSAVDAAWYHMDGPANTAVVTAVAITRRPLDIERMRRLVRRRLLRFERFRQRVVEQGLGLAMPAWEDVTVDLGVHLRHAALPAPCDEATLSAFIEDLASVSLDRTRPLWQMHVVDKVGTGGALVMRYHHCIGDGSAMMAVAARLFDMPPHAIPAKAVPGAAGGTVLLDEALQLAGETGALVADLLKRPDPQSPLKGTCGVRKHVAWSAPVPLADIQAVGAGRGAKVNDVLVAAITGALRTYLRRRGVDVGRTTLRAMVPVDLRTPEHYGELGNEFGLVILDLPIAEPTPQARLARTCERMGELKRSAEGPAMRQLLDLLGRGPKLIEDLACEIFGSKASLVLTNVAGPADMVQLANVPVDRLLFCVPHPGDQIGMGLSVLSYRRMITLTVIADAALVPHPETITRDFGREIAVMVRHVRRPASRHAGARTSQSAS
jgi:WS/DGAT/MGAT family acyltransferase